MTQSAWVTRCARPCQGSRVCSRGPGAAGSGSPVSAGAQALPPGHPGSGHEGAVWRSWTSAEGLPQVTANLWVSGSPLEAVMGPRGLNKNLGAPRAGWGCSARWAVSPSRPTPCALLTPGPGHIPPGSEGLGPCPGSAPHPPAPVGSLAACLEEAQAGSGGRGPRGQAPRLPTRRNLGFLRGPGPWAETRPQDPGA